MITTDSRTLIKISGLFVAIGIVGSYASLAQIHGQISVSGDVFPSEPPTNPTWNVTFQLSLGGFQSEGCLMVASGGTVNCQSSSIGNGVGSTGLATISGSNARWICDGQLRVGNGGFGTLNVNSGGQVSSLFADQGVPSAIGIGSSGPGVANLSGPGSLIHTPGILDVGFSGGELNVDNGATITASRLRVTGSSKLGSKAGVLNLYDGLISITNSIRLDGGTINLKGGTLSGESLLISNFQAEPVLNICDGVLDVDFIFGDLSLDGGTMNTASIVGNIEHNAGSLSPGSSPGTTMISGNYDLNGGAIEIEIAGVTQGSQYDLVSVGGFMNIDSNAAELSVSFLDGFQDSILPNDTFTILTSISGIAGNFNGSPDDAMIQTVDGEGFFQINYLGTSIVLSNFTRDDDTPLPGDVNQDGIVNLLDIELFVALLNSGEFQSEADINQDGIVNLLDIEGFVSLISGG